MSQPKLMVDNKDVQPTKKVKLYKKISHAEIGRILKDPEALASLKVRLKEEKNVQR